MSSDRKKRVLLVNTNTERIPYPVPPLGLALLASRIRDDYEVEVWDGLSRGAEGLPGFVQEFGPDYIGFGIRNIDDMVMDRNVYYPADIIEKFILPVRRITRSPIILGGSGFSIFPGELMRLTGADYGIAGEGEESFPDLLRELDSGVFPEKGIISVSKKYISVPGQAGMRFSEIDRWIDLEPYRQRGAYSIQTKRGCAHRCIYCTYPSLEGRSFRVRTPASVADEIEELYRRQGPMTVEFVDSTFNDPAGHAEEICREIIRRGIRMRFRTMGINPRHTSRELFSLMREAGFVQVDATPDSASPAMLESMGKGFRLEDVIRTAEMIRETGLPAMWFFLFGGPGEDESTVQETFRFIDRYVAPEDMVHMSAGLRIYPGTPLHSLAMEEGIVNSDTDLLYPSPYYFSPKIGKQRLDDLLEAAAEARFNCIPAMESAPPPVMMAEAIEMRKKEGLDEPMFRTLLRLRKRDFEARRILHPLQ